MERVKQVVLRVDEVRRSLRGINARMDDAEMAHAMEDDLYEAVLRGIATGTLSLERCVHLAETALRSKDIAFGRWTA